MSHTLQIINAFTNRPFAGNPAAVCVLAAPAEEAWMKLVARETGGQGSFSFIFPIPTS